MQPNSQHIHHICKRTITLPNTQRQTHMHTAHRHPATNPNVGSCTSEATTIETRLEVLLYRKGGVDAASVRHPQRGELNPGPGGLSQVAAVAPPEGARLPRRPRAGLLNLHHGARVAVPRRSYGAEVHVWDAHSRVRRAALGCHCS